MAAKNDSAPGSWTNTRVERGIYKRVNSATGEVRYFATLRTRRGTANGTFSTISKARDFIAKSKTDINESRFFGNLPGAKLGVAKAVEQFIKDKGITHSTQLGRSRWWADRFKDLPLVELDAERVAEALGDLKETGITGATVNRYRAALSGMWRHWSKARAGSPALVPAHTNPARGVASEDDSEERIFTLNKEQRSALFAACGDDVELHAAVRLSLASGCRYGELCRLKWKDIDLVKRTAALHRTKNGERRPIAFNEATAALLKRLPRGIANALVFSERITKYHLRRDLWADLTERAGRKYEAMVREGKAQAGPDYDLRAMRWHDMRHVSMQVAIETGSTLVEAGLHTGHKSLAALKRYSHLDSTHQRKIADRVGDAL